MKSEQTHSTKSEIKQKLIYNCTTHGKHCTSQQLKSNIKGRDVAVAYTIIAAMLDSGELIAESYNGKVDPFLYYTLSSDLELIKYANRAIKAI